MKKKFLWLGTIVAPLPIVMVTSCGWSKSTITNKLKPQYGSGEEAIKDGYTYVGHKSQTAAFSWNKENYVSYDIYQKTCRDDNGDKITKNAYVIK